jgi:hypothetical protein
MIAFFKTLFFHILRHCLEIMKHASVSTLLKLKVRVNPTLRELTQLFRSKSAEAPDYIKWDISILGLITELWYGKWATSWRTAVGIPFLHMHFLLFSRFTYHYQLGSRHGIISLSNKQAQASFRFVRNHKQTDVYNNMYYRFICHDSGHWNKWPNGVQFGLKGKLKRHGAFKTQDIVLKNAKKFSASGESFCFALIKQYTLT